MKINMIIKIENLADVNTRLDIYLVKKLEQYKRAIIQENILNNNILVNGVATKASYRLKQNDEISLQQRQIGNMSNPSNILNSFKMPEMPKINIPKF